VFADLGQGLFAVGLKHREDAPVDLVQAFRVAFRSHRS
jgi:hypothetical protein